jgi:hypothetical protein
MGVTVTQYWLNPAGEWVDDYRYAISAGGNTWGAGIFRIQDTQSRSAGAVSVKFRMLNCTHVVGIRLSTNDSGRDYTAVGPSLIAGYASTADNSDGFKTLTDPIGKAYDQDCYLVIDSGWEGPWTSDVELLELFHDGESIWSVSEVKGQVI